MQSYYLSFLPKVAIRTIKIAGKYLVLWLVHVLHKYGISVYVWTVFTIVTFLQTLTKLRASDSIASWMMEEEEEETEKNVIVINNLKFWIFIPLSNFLTKSNILMNGTFEYGTHKISLKFLRNTIITWCLCKHILIRHIM